MDRKQWAKQKDPSMKRPVPKCGGCEKPMYDARDVALGMCSTCYPPHSSPACRKGYCVVAVRH